MSKVPVDYVHGTHDCRTHAMPDHVRQLSAQSASVSITDFHQTPLKEEKEGVDYDRAGLITDDWLLDNTDPASAEYYICGPRLFSEVPCRP